MSLDRDDLDRKFASWLDRIADMHEGAHHRANEVATLAPLRVPLEQATVGLLSTAGVHLDTDTAFDVDDPHGDPTWRLIPDDVDLARLRFSHTHYDTAGAERDPNVVLPIEPLHRLVAEGRVGASTPFHIGMMGFNPDPLRVRDEAAPQVVEAFREAGADAVVLAPG